MASRFFTFLILCTLALLLARREDNRNSGSVFDDAHLGWLHANSDVDHRTADVLLIVVDDGDAPPSERIFQSWPLSELDYALLLENLFQNRPKAVAIEPILAWPSENAPFLESLSARLKKAPPMVLGSLAEFSEFSTEPIDQAPEGKGDSIEQLIERHFQLQNIRGQIGEIPRLTQFLNAPAKAVAGEIPLAVTHIDLGDNIASPGDGTLRVPLLARHEEKVIATFPLTALMLHRELENADLTIELGKAITGPDLNVPIDQAGRFSLDLESLQSLPEINSRLFALSLSSSSGGSVDGTRSANDVITGLIESDADYAKVELLHSHLAVIGQCDRGAHRFSISSNSDGNELESSLSRAEVFCQTIAAMDVGQQLIKAPDWSRYAIGGGAFLCMAVLLTRNRPTVLKGAILFALLLAVTSLLAFQQWHVWFPAFVAMVIIACGALAAVLVPDA